MSPSPSIGHGSFWKDRDCYLKKIALNGTDGDILREDLELFDVLNRLIREAETVLETLFSNDPRVRLLRSVPGLGPVLAGVVALEIDRADRFATPAKLSAHAGLVPSTYASGGKVRGP